MPLPLNNLNNQEEEVKSAVELAAKAIRSFKKKPFENLPIRLIAILLVFLNTLSVQGYIDLLAQIGIEISVKTKDLNPWYTVIWALIIVYLFVRAVAQKMKQLEQSVTYNVASKSPIKGFLSFDFSDADIFKNLERMPEMQKYRNAILDQQFRVGILMGVSGCGKTSLLKAGLTPMLKEEADTLGVVVTLTNKPPMESVLEAMQEQMKGEEIKSTKSLYELLSSISLVKSHGRLVIIFDQFEQFFTQNPVAEQRTAFIEELNRVYVSLPEVKILLSIRRDFSGHLIEIQRVLNYSLNTVSNYFVLDKFQPDQVVRIIKYIATYEQVAEENIDERFVLSLSNKELADEDGLVSAANIQILLWIMKSKRNNGGITFTESSFQKMGGIEGLLQDFLESQLASPNFFNTKNEVLYCLLALINLNTNVRAGQITVEELKSKLHETVDPNFLDDILSWLEKTRLINKIESKTGARYELAHEKLIDPIRNIENKTDIDSRKATQLLEKRTNEWLSNKKSARFYLPYRELRFIQKNRKLLTWGEKESTKREYIDSSYNYLRKWVVGATAVFLMALLVWGVRTTLFYKLEIRAENDIKEKLLQSKNSITPDFVILGSLLDLDSAFTSTYCTQTNDDRVLESLIKATLKRDSSDKTIKRLLPIANSLRLNGTQINALLKLGGQLSLQSGALKDSIYRAIVEKLFMSSSNGGAELQFNATWKAVLTAFIRAGRAKEISLIRDFARKRESTSRVNLLLGIYSQMLPVNTDSARSYINEAIECAPLKNLSLANLETILTFAEHLSQSSDTRSIAYYSKSISLVLSENLVRQDYEERDDNLMDIISSLIKQRSKEMQLLGLSLYDKLSLTESRTDCLDDICSAIKLIPDLNVEVFNRICDIAVATSIDLEKVTRLFVVREAVEKNKPFAKQIINRTYALVKQFKQPDDKAFVKDALDKFIADTVTVAGTAIDITDVKSFLLAFDARLTSEARFNVSRDAFFAEWAESHANALVKSDKDARKEIFSGLLSKLFRQENAGDTVKRSLLISAIHKIANVKELPPASVDSLISFEKKLSGKLPLLKFLKANADSHKELILKNENWLDEICSKTQLDQKHNYNIDHQTTFGVISDLYLSISKFKKAERILARLESATNNINYYLKQGENSLVYYKIGLVKNYKNRKNHWQHLFW